MQTLRASRSLHRVLLAASGDREALVGCRQATRAVLGAGAGPGPVSSAAAAHTAAAGRRSYATDLAWEDVRRSFSTIKVAGGRCFRAVLSC